LSHGVIEVTEDHGNDLRVNLVSLSPWLNFVLN